MIKVVRILALCLTVLAVSACGIYSFSGTSIKPDVKTITINYIEYKAMKVNPSLSNDLTEAIRNQFRRMTSLEQVEMDGDLEISGQVTGYDVRASAVTAGDVAAMNRLTVTVKVDFTNRKYPEEDFTGKSFSAYAEYPSTESLDSQESVLCPQIIDEIVENIFNATVAQW
ncbi:MAG: LptE family protein [Bacteroidales bacterium]|nr:LptE family protein [Bacteroidales bacterium]